MKANPFGNLEMEVLHFNVVKGSGTNDDEVYSQAVTTSSLTGRETWAKPVMEPYQRPELELRKMHVLSGADTRGTQDKKAGEAGPALDVVANTK